MCVILIMLSNNTKYRVLKGLYTPYTEIYLSHMALSRVIEELGLNKAIGNGWVQYFVTAVVVLAGTTLFAVVMQKLIGIIINRIEVMVKR